MEKEVDIEKLNSMILKLINSSDEEKKNIMNEVLSLYTKDKECILNTENFQLSSELQCELLLHEKTPKLFPFISSPIEISIRNRDPSINESLFAKKNKKVLDAYMKLISNLNDIDKEKELNLLTFIVMKNKDFTWLDFFLNKIGENNLKQINIKAENLISIFSYKFIDDFDYVKKIRDEYPSEELDYLILSKTKNNDLMNLILKNVKTLDRCIELIENLEKDINTFLLTNDDEIRKEKVKLVIIRYEKIKLSTMLNESSKFEDLNIQDKRRL